MSYLNYRDSVGVTWGERISDSLKKLRRRKDKYEKEGYRCWIFPYNEKKWVLSIKFTKDGFLNAA